MSAAVRPQHVPPISVRLNDGESPSHVFKNFDIAQFVKAEFDGAIGDAPKFETLADAEDAISRDLRRRFPGLTVSQVESALVFVVFEWNRRAADATGVCS